ncbi:MAG: hypothetical protein NC218_03360 [Acetobacter sp.]|nr:hypothetical protein [Acetobacter sp.]
MGLRLHYAKRYEVEWDGGHFNWRSEELEEVLRNWGVEVYYDNADDTTSNMEINMTQVGEKLKEYAKKGTSGKQVLVKNAGDPDWCITLEDMREWYAAVMKYADLKGDYAHFAWF